MAWQDIWTQIEKYLSTIDHHQPSPQQIDIGAATTSQKCQSCGNQTHKRSERARLVANEDTWQRCAEVETHRHKETAVPRALEKALEKVQAKAKAKARAEHLKHVCGKEGHKKADCKFKTAFCSNCGKVGHLRAVCQNTNTHEIEKDNDEPSPEVTVEAVWCKAVQNIVEDDHCDHSEKHERSSEHRD